MRRHIIRIAIAALALLAVSVAPAQFIELIFNPPASSDVVFTPLHLFFMSPSGSDGANGLTPGTAWATPNHALNCGDVIIAAGGSYNGDLSHWGTVSNCPSTSGGIDGAGGIQAAVLLCGVSDLGANGCIVDCATAQCNTGPVGSGGRTNPASAMNVNQNNWAVIGWNTKGNGTCSVASCPTPGKLGIVADACLTQTTLIHHVMFINSVVVNSGVGFGTDECGYNHNVPGNGVDYWAVVGTISQNAAQQAICNSAIDPVGMAPFDSNAGTHTYIVGNFVFTSLSGSVGNGGCAAAANSDMEAIMLDTPDAHGYTGQTIISNNMMWNNVRYSVQVFYQSFHNTALTVKINNNTGWSDLIGVCANGGNCNKDFAPGMINLAASSVGGVGAPTLYTISVQNNIMVTDAATVNGATLYAAAFGGTTWGSLTVGGTGNENWFKGMAASCLGTCNSGDDIVEFNSNPLGTNTFTSPAFTNTSDLLTNWVGAPNCTGVATTTACMGYNVATGALTPNTPISDLKPTAGGTSGKGYQLPSPTCNTNADYPAYLKGLVRLQWNSATSTITQKRDLVTVPCGL